MMKFISLSRRRVAHTSQHWRESSSLPGVSFAIRSVSLGERLQLMGRLQELCLRDEFLAAGNASDQLKACRSELLVRRLYLEWGLLHIRGLEIDGTSATPGLLIEYGPEALSNEIIGVIKAELGLTEEERKNS